MPYRLHSIDATKTFARCLEVAIRDLQNRRPRWYAESSGRPAAGTAVYATLEQQGQLTVTPVNEVSTDSRFFMRLDEMLADNLNVLPDERLGLTLSRYWAEPSEGYRPAIVHRNTFFILEAGHGGETTLNIVEDEKRHEKGAKTKKGFPFHSYSYGYHGAGTTQPEATIALFTAMLTFGSQGPMPMEPQHFFSADAVLKKTRPPCLKAEKADKRTP